jgi:hypothetical protein
VNHAEIIPSPPRRGEGQGEVSKNLFRVFGVFRTRWIRRRQFSGFFFNAHSQMRITRQPFRRKARLTSASRFLFLENLRRQNTALPFGFVPCLGQPCQKQPSTKTASRSFGKIKSGRTDSDE